ncbi:MAG TPA: flagellar basal body protein [Bryobacteraceae bacterium]|jgi:flagellar basal-body rod protein FlgB|nr:flagellar basal body protein [Bryobacteraceae bacterium]
MLDPTSSQLDRYLTLVSARQRLVSSNVANADTPGYKTKDLDFESELRNSVSSTPNITEVSGLKIKNDGNNVDLDREARLMAENDLRFTVASNLLHSNLKQLRMAIEGGSSSSS